MRNPLKKKQEKKEKEANISKPIPRGVKDGVREIVQKTEGEDNVLGLSEQCQCIRPGRGIGLEKLNAGFETSVNGITDRSAFKGKGLNETKREG
jgi:hypothetical protein